MRFRGLAKVVTLLIASSLLVQDAASQGNDKPALPSSLRNFVEEDNLKFSHLAVEHGLSQGTVNAIVQDRHGFLWLGTEDGLNRFDGYTFRVFKHQSGDTTSLSNSFIWDLAIDSTGTLWIATEYGLNCYDATTQSFQRYHHDPDDSTSLSSDIVQTLCVDRQGALWIGTWGGGMSYYVRGSDSFERLTLPGPEDSENSASKIWAILHGSQGDLWVGTDGAGVFRISASDSGALTAASATQRLAQGAYRQYRLDGTDGGLTSDIIVRIFEDSFGDVWIGTYGGGLNRFERRRDRFQHYKRGSGVTDDIVWTIAEDLRGLLWIGTMSQGVNIYDRKRDTFRTLRASKGDPESLSSDNIRSLFQDKGGVFWVGTLAKGLNKTDRKASKFLHLSSTTAEPVLANNFIFTICESENGDLWVGTYGSGIVRFTATGERRQYRHDPADPTTLDSDQVRTIFQDSRGIIWVGTYFGGLNRYRPESDTFEHFPFRDGSEQGPSHESIRTIFESEDGTLWLGTNGGGLNRVVAPQSERPTFEHFRSGSDDSASLSNDHVLSIAEDSAGRLWIGTYGGGANVFDPSSGSWRYHTVETGRSGSLNDNVVVETFVADDGTVWLGTWSGGLNRFIADGDSFAHITEADGLPSNLVCGILPDDSGYLWVCTEKGVARLHPSTSALRAYDFSDGLQKASFNPGAKCKLQTGWLLFGGVEGINLFRPRHVYDNPYVPGVEITSFEIFEKPVPLPRPDNGLPTIDLGYDQRFFSFEFSALDFTNPEKNRYRYKLEGFDDEWVDAGTRRYASYTNLDAGDYLFKVRGSNNDALWNDEGTAVAITIVPPFYLTWWFRALVLLAVAGLLVWIYRSRVASLKKEKAAQENFSRRLITVQEEERSRIAAELHDSLGQDLLIVNNSIQQLAGAREDDTETRSGLEQISESVVRSLNHVREISSNLHPHQVERLGLEKALEAMLRKLRDSTNLTIAFEMTASQVSFKKEVEVGVYRIIQEALTNVIKHARASNVNIRISEKARSIRIEIEDDGIGFEPRDGVAQHERSGFGLVSISERVRILAGRFRIDAASGAGTKLSITLPKDKALA